MVHSCYVVLSITRNVYTNAISEVTILNSFETMQQAKASLQYEYDVCLHENSDPLDDETKPVWLNEDHTELRLSPGCDPSFETVVSIDFGANFHDKDEPNIRYHAEK